MKPNKTKTKKVKRIKAYGVAVNIKKGWYLDHREIYLLKGACEIARQKNGFGGKVIPVIITYSLNKE